ncbi:MAG: DUF2061 domain-containing protein [Alcanivoracaceae bacterium]
MSKTLSFAVMHFSVAFAVVWLMTGDWVIGGLTALVEPLVNTVGYHFHEKVWQRRSSPGAGAPSLPA